MKSAGLASEAGIPVRRAQPLKDELPAAATVLIPLSTTKRITPAN
jgi:hypothetical protein